MRIIVSVDNMASQVDPDAVNFLISVRVEGDTRLLSRIEPMLFGLSYGALVTRCREVAVELAAEAGIAVAADDTVQVFGLPPPTLADLGGA